MTTTTMLASAPSYDIPPHLGRAPSYDFGAPLPSYSPAVDPPPAYSVDDVPPPPRRAPAPVSLLAQAARTRQPHFRQPSPRLQNAQRPPPPETSLLAQAARGRQPHFAPSPSSPSIDLPPPPETSLLAQAAAARRPQSVHTPGNSASTSSSPRVSLGGNTSVLRPAPRSVLGYHLGAEVGGRWSLFGGSGAEEYHFTAQTVNGKLRMVTSSSPRGQDVVAEVDGEWMNIFEDRMKAGTMGTVVRGRALRWVWVRKGLLVMEGEEVVGRWVYAKRWKKRLDGGVLEVFEKGVGGRDIVALLLAVVARRALGRE